MLVLITHSFINHITLHTTHYHFLHELLILVACITILPIYSAKVLSIVNLVIHPSSPSFPHPLALGHLPSSSQILHIPQIHELTQAGRQADITSSLAPPSKPDAMIMVSAGLPPVPTKIVNRIQGGLFVEMYELLPSMLTSTQYNTIEDDSRKSKHRRELSIMEWVQSFGVYMATVSRTKPHRIPDLLGYQ